MFEAKEAISVEAAIRWYTEEYLVGKRRERTIEEYRSDLENLFAEIPVKRVVDLSLSHLDHYVATRTPLLSPATLRRRLSALSSFLAALKSRDLIPHNVMEKFERPELVDRLPHYLSSDEVHHLRSVVAAEPRVFAIVALLLESGIRAGELIQLTTNDMNLETSERFIIVRGVSSRTKKDRIIYLSAETSRLLSTYLQGRPHSPTPIFFLNRFGKPFALNSIEKLLKRYFVKAGFPNLHVHDLRHTFAVHSLKQRRPLNVLQKTLGHASLSTTSIYARANNEEFKNYFSSPLFS